MTSPVKSSSLARPRPTTRGRRYPAPMSAPQRPTFGKMNPNLAASLAMRKSQARAMTAPAPTAMPLTAATTGLRTFRIDAMSAPVMRVKSSRPCMSRENSSPMMSSTSPPEQNARPSPVRTIARISGCRSVSSRTSRSSR